jgi:hypothetical protein
LTGFFFNFSSTLLGQIVHLLMWDGFDVLASIKDSPKQQRNEYEYREKDKMPEATKTPPCKRGILRPMLKPLINRDKESMRDSARSESYAVAYVRKH